MQYDHSLRQQVRRPRMPRSLPDHIDRREALRRATLVLGAAISGPTLAAVLAGCDARPHAAAAAARPLSDAQAELIAAVAEQIVPETDTPGATSAGVPRFIATMLAEYYTPIERDRFLAGLADVDARARARYGRPFVSCTADRQHAIVLALDSETFAAPAGHATAPGPHPAPSFYRMMKELTVVGYYTSEPGATKELRYVQVPGRFEGCVPLASIGRAWAV